MERFRPDQFQVPKMPVEKPTFDVVNGKIVQLEPQDIAYREAFREGKMGYSAPPVRREPFRKK